MSLWLPMMLSSSTQRGFHIKKRNQYKQACGGWWVSKQVIASNIRDLVHYKRPRLCLREKKLTDLGLLLQHAIEDEPQMIMAKDAPLLMPREMQHNAKQASKAQQLTNMEPDKYYTRNAM